MKPELKKLLVLNLPYLLFVYLFAKCGQAYRLAAGADASAKLLHLTNGISAAFANPLPSLHPFDLCVGIAGAVAVRLIVYGKGKNAKKYGVDFTLRKDKTTQPPHYIVIFKAKDADNLEQAFREFTAKTLSKEQRPSIRKVLAVAKQKAAQQPKRAKEKVKQRGLER